MAILNGQEIIFAAVKGDKGDKGEKGDCVAFVESVNKFNKKSPLNKSGYWQFDGERDDTAFMRTHPILVTKGKLYKWKQSSGVGDNKRLARVTKGGELIELIDFGYITDDGYAVYQAVETGYISVNLSSEQTDDFMVCLLDEYPSEYVRFRHYLEDTYSDKFAEQAKELDGVLTPETTNFITRTKSINIFDANAENVSGYYNPAGVFNEASSYVSYLIPIDGSGEYSLAADRGLFGDVNVVKLCLFDKDKNYIKTILGELGSGTVSASSYVHVVHTVTESDLDEGACYFGYSIKKSIAYALMIVKGAEYPAEYVPFEDYLTIKGLRTDTSNLRGKMIAFDGDSICASNPAYDSQSGWAGRIGVKNAMTWKNYAVGGGTITADLYNNGVARHWLSRSIDDIHEQMPALDYLILEGGTNDADLIGDNAEKYGTFNENDYSGNYDDTTFCGAAESLLYKALTYFPYAKIGFIIAPKMGKTSASVGYGSANNRRKYFLQLEAICKKWGVPYIDLWEESPMNPMHPTHYDSSLTVDENISSGKLYMDGQHPTPKGYGYITDKIEAFIKNL